MIGPVLQLCGGGGFVDYVTGFEFFKAVGCTYINPLGLAFTAMLVYGGVAIPITLRTDSVMIPTILLLLTGGATFATISSPAVSLGTIALIFAGPAVITLLLFQYAR